MHLKIAENSSPNQGNLVSVSKKRKLFLHITRGKILKAPQVKIFVIGTTFTQKSAKMQKKNDFGFNLGIPGRIKEKSPSTPGGI